MNKPEQEVTPANGNVQDITGGAVLSSEQIAERAKAQAAERDDIDAAVAYDNEVYGPLTTGADLDKQIRRVGVPLVAGVLALTLIGNALLGKKEQGGDRAVHDGTPPAPKVIYTDTSSAAALENGPQTTITVLPGEGPAQVGERVVPSFNTTNERRNNVIQNLEGDQPDGFQPGDQVDLPTPLVDANKANQAVKLPMPAPNNTNRDPLNP